MNDPQANPDQSSRQWPSWLISLVLHVVVIVALGMFFKQTVRGQSGGEEPGRNVGIVLKRMTDDGEMFEGEGDFAEDAIEPTETTAETSDAVAALPSESDMPSASDALPAQMPAIGMGALGGSGNGDAQDMAGSPKQARVTGGGGITGGGGDGAHVEFFDVDAEGFTFVYVLDRSISMTGEPLAAAKRELIESLEGLGAVHKFQIIFFNHNRRTFDLSGGQDRMPFADERTRELARRFIMAIRADGGTDREAALMAALKMRPDVIFFLTDADDPMFPGELERVRSTNRGGASIHTIEFGFGRSPGGDNFLKKLARDNAGKHGYVDISRL